MKITIEPETDAEKADPRIKRVVFANMAAIAVVGINAEHPDDTALYFHAASVPMLQQRVCELQFQLTKARFIAEAAQAKAQQPLIQVAQPNIPFPGPVNDRMQGK